MSWEGLKNICAARRYNFAFYMTYSFLRRLYGSRRSAIELPGGVNDSSCHEKVDYSCFSALCSGDGAGFLRERFRR